MSKHSKEIKEGGSYIKTYHKNTNLNLDAYMNKLNKKNPIAFKTKNDFFYENAFMIIESSPIVSNNSYLDVLETVKGNKNIRGKKSECWDGKKKNKIDKYSTNEEYLRKCINSSKFGNTKIQNHRRNKKINLTDVIDITDIKNIKDIRSNLITNSLDTNIAFTTANTQIQTQYTSTNNGAILEIDGGNILKSDISISPKNKSRQSSRNIVNNFTMDGKNRRSFKFRKLSSKDDFELNLENFSPSKFQLNYTKTAHKKKSSKQADPIINTQVNTQNNPISTSNSTSPTKNDNQAILHDINRTRFKYYLNSQIKNGKKLDSKLIKNYISKYPDKFIFDKQNFSYILKTENTNTNNKQKDDFINRLSTLDRLHQSLPEFRPYISQMKETSSKAEKRKIKSDYYTDELNSHLDKILSEHDDKVKWKEINLKEINYETIRNIRQIDNKESKSKNKSDFITPENYKYKPKYKKYGDCKILLIPKELKETPDISQSTNILTVSSIQNNIKEILGNKITSMKTKKYLDNMSRPKSVHGSIFKYNSEVCGKIFSKCSNLENKNLKLMNAVKHIKKKYKNNNLFVSPKSAFIIPKVGKLRNKKNNY